jgi:hypothetical protein
MVERQTEVNKIPLPLQATQTFFRLSPPQTSNEDSDDDSDIPLDEATLGFIRRLKTNKTTSDDKTVNHEEEDRRNDLIVERIMRNHIADLRESDNIFDIVKATQLETELLVSKNFNTRKYRRIKNSRTCDDIRIEVMNHSCSLVPRELKKNFRIINWDRRIFPNVQKYKFG